MLKLILLTLKLSYFFLSILNQTLKASGFTDHRKVTLPNTRKGKFLEALPHIHNVVDKIPDRKDNF